MLNIPVFIQTHFLEQIARLYRKKRQIETGYYVHVGNVEQGLFWVFVPSRQNRHVVVDFIPH